MALWQFDVRVVPRAALENATGDVPLTMSQSEYLNKDHDWSEYGTLEGLAETLSETLKTRKTWSADIKGWGEEDGDRVDIYYHSNVPESWSVRFDMRSLDHPFTIKIVDLAADYNAVFVTQERYVISPSYSKLLARMQRSSSFKFVENPEKFFNQIDKQEDENGD